ncbi:MAG: Calx-beta domain-containing protein, partial [Pseudomonadota bacterium]
MKTIFSTLAILITTCLLTACGGGSGGDDVPDDNGGGGGGSATPALSISDTTLTEGNSGITSLAFSVTLSAATTSEVTVDFTTQDIDADDSDYTPTSGTVRIAAGATAASIDIPVSGDTTIERDERMSVELSNPQNATLADAVGEGTIVNDDFSLLSIASASQTEGDSGVTALSFVVSLDRPGIDAVTVDFAASDAAALTGSDYTAETGTLELAAGDVSGSFDITIIGDTDIEADEQFVVNLLNASPNARIEVDEATGLIINDDFAKVSIAPGGITESDTNSRTLAMPISLDAASPEDVIVSYATEDVTASAGEDYVAANASIVIPAGDTSATITLEVLGDTIPEPVEALLVTLTEVDGAAMLDQNLALATIIDDDGENLEPTLVLQPAGVTEGDTGTTLMQFLFLLTEPLTEELSFDVATAAVSATAGVDYTDITTTVSIPAGDQSALLAVTVLNDTDEEQDESFSLTVSNLSTTVAVPAGTVLGTIADNDSEPTDPLPRLRVSDAEVQEGDSG